MSDAFLLGLASCAGLLLGLVFFWGLWLTVAGLDHAPHPARRVIASMLVRFGVVIAGFYLLADFGGWQPVTAAGIGFVLSRYLVIRLTRERPVDVVSGESDA